MDNVKDGSLGSPGASATQLHLMVLESHLSVCKYDAMPSSLPDGGFCCVTRTEDELSVVCETAHTPQNPVAREDGWRALKVQGPLDFGLVGILAGIATALADAGVALFAVSTYDTDYILVKDAQLEAAITALRQRGCTVDAS